ncbi:MAG: hypothetical protein OXU88_01345, partial [Gammaproteobacteria bacterium]|nr:hypothetical protein [Gammaproteobacteria bacterium]
MAMFIVSSVSVGELVSWWVGELVGWWIGELVLPVGRYRKPAPDAPNSAQYNRDFGVCKGG